MADLVYPLLIAHLLGDFAFQTDRMIAAKRQYGALGVSPHIAVLGLLTFAAVAPDLGRWWPYVLILLVTHYALDAAKVQVDQGTKHHSHSLALFFLDQVFHLLTIWGIALLARAAGLGALWSLSREAWAALLVGVTITFAYGILLRVLAPGVGWPNRWVSVLARGATILLVLLGYGWLAWLPALLGVGYQRWRGEPLTRALWVDLLLGSLLAFLAGSLLLR